ILIEWATGSCRKPPAMEHRTGEGDNRLQRWSVPCGPLQRPLKAGRYHISARLLPLPCTVSTATLFAPLSELSLEAGVLGFQVLNSPCEIPFRLRLCGNFRDHSTHRRLRDPAVLVAPFRRKDFLLQFFRRDAVRLRHPQHDAGHRRRAHPISTYPEAFK